VDRGNGSEVACGWGHPYRTVDNRLVVGCGRDLLFHNNVGLRFKRVKQRGIEELKRKIKGVHVGNLTLPEGRCRK